MRVVIASAYFPPYAPGGAEESLVEIVGRFTRHGIDATVVTNAYDGREGVERVDGCGVMRMACPLRLAPGPDVDASAYLASDGYRVLLRDTLVNVASASGDPVLLLANNTPCYGAVAEAAGRASVPALAIVRDAEVLCATGACMESRPAAAAEPCRGVLGAGRCNVAFQRSRGARGWRPWPGMFLDGIRMGLARRRLQRELHGMDRVVTISDALNRLVGASMPALRRRLRTIPNFGTSASPAGEAEVGAFLAAQGLRAGGYVLMAGKKSHGKGTDVMTAAMAHLHREGLSMAALLLGKGRLAGPAPVGVVDHPAVGKPMLMGLLRRAAALVVPGRCQEGLHRSMQDALFYGIPVVCTEAGGVQEGVRDGITGRVVPCNDVASLAAAIRDVTGWNEERRAQGAREARRLFDEKFGEDRILGLWQDVLSELGKHGKQG